MSPRDSLPEKTCARCGRRFAWRKAWARDWEEVRYCSDACRRRKLDALDLALERAIVDLLERRARTATICPSEAARHVAEDDDEKWRAWMERTRMAARRLVARGEVVIVQRGRVVDPSRATGPIRIGRPPTRAARADDSTT